MSDGEGNGGSGIDDGREGAEQVISSEGAASGEVTGEPTEALTEPEGSRQAVRLAKILVGVTTVLGIVAVFTVGIRAQLLDTDEWVGLSTEVLQEPAVQESVASHLVDVLYTELDVGEGVAELLPEDLQGLGGPLAGALRGPLTDAVVGILDSDVFQSLWEETNRTAHETLVSILRDETRDGVSTAGGAVTLQLNGLVLAVGEALGLPDSLLDGLPDDAGDIVVFESDELDTVQQLVKILDFVAWFLLALVIALFALSVYLAKGSRIQILRRVGWSLLSIGVIVLTARAIAVRTIIDAVVDDPVTRPAAEAVATIGTALLGQMGWAALVYGLLFILFTSLLGDSRWATWTRRALSPALNTSGGPLVGGIGVVLLLVIWWSPGRAFEGWITALTLIGLVIGAILTVRARTSEEFSDTTWDDVRESLPFRNRTPAT